ncbi:hypothetical protein EG871_13890, partial [Enterococcus faecium]
MVSRTSGGASALGATMRSPSGFWADGAGPGAGGRKVAVGADGGGGAGGAAGARASGAARAGHAHARREPDQRARGQ